MSSGDKSSPRTPRGRRKKTGAATSKATRKSPPSSRKPTRPREPPAPAPPRAAERPAALELIFRLSRILERKKLRWYLFGAQAVNLFSTPRMSADVDVTVAVPEDEKPSLLAALRRAGFLARVQDIERFAERTRVLPFVHAPTGVPLDLVLAGDGLEESFLERAELRSVADFRVPVIAREDLVVAKILAGRPKDLEDVRNLLQHQPSLDTRQVRALLAELDALLERADLLPTFERLLAE